MSAALLGFGGLPYKILAAEEFTKLTILHTNDVHSRIEPFPTGSKFAGMGGAAARAAIIDHIRKEEENVLLFDCGDIFQGTPYFNYFGGRLEFELMSKMGYDAATIGNHDFDAGLDGFSKQLPFAKFPFLSANYDFSETMLEGKIEKYKIFEKNKLKIGAFGLGIELEGLVPEKLYGNTKYLDPIDIANSTAGFLKKKLNCNLVVCLSHLGFKYQNQKISDVVLAKESKNIDIILGGHTHTFFDKPEVLKNADQRAVILNQVGWAGLVLGRLDIVFDERLSKKEIFFDTVKVS